MRAMHFICRRSDGVHLNNLHFDEKMGLWRSGKWNISPDVAQALVGGWLYLHPTKAAPSEFGGIVEGFEEVVDRTLPRSHRIELLVRSSSKGKGKPWRGKAHGQAHSGGLIFVDFTHETAGLQQD